MNLFMMLAHILSATYSIVYAVVVKRSITLVRLSWLASRKPRYATGTFKFRFGQVDYVDASSLPGQYTDIFIDSAYEVLDLGVSANIIDCGGNIGLSTIWFKRRYPSARVTVFEADPMIAAVLKRNVHNLHLQSVNVVSAAVGAESNPVMFQSDGADGGRVGMGSGLTVESVRLSDYIHEPVDLLKLDIEGSEYDVVQELWLGGKLSLVRNIVCEVHNYSNATTQISLLWDCLVKAGFRVVVTKACVAEWMQDIPDPTPFAAVPSGRFLLQLYAWRQ